MEATASDLLFDAIQLVVIVTPAASVSFFRPEFDDFLYAPIGTERNDTVERNR